MEQIECDICGGENKPGAECDNFICPNYEPNRTKMNDSDLLAAVHGIIDLNERLIAVTDQRDGMRKRIAQLEDELANACVKVEELAEIGLDQMDKERSTNKKLFDYRGQRDRLGMALQELCEALLTGNPRDITELLNKAGDALQFTTNPNEL